MKASPPLVNQTKGMLLEEVILLLLTRSGYRPVEEPNGDPTLDSCSAGLQVRGRGGLHQIDAVADFAVVPPFTYPQRLLVEGKCYKRGSIELETVRNALGVFKDVSEFWTGATRVSPPDRRRFHYQYAIFATCDFSKPSQDFAFAHDIHLFPLAHSAFFRPIIPAIEQAARRIAPRLKSSKKQDPALEPLTLSQVRKMTRATLAGGPGRADGAILPALISLRDACAQVGAGYIAMAGGVFPLLLIPERQATVDTLPNNVLVRVRYRDNGWYIEEASDARRRLFSFDLPIQLFEQYAESGALTRIATTAIKQTFFSELQVVVMKEQLPQLITLRMDPAWFTEIRGKRP